MYIVPCPTVSMRLRPFAGMSRFSSVNCPDFTVAICGEEFSGGVARCTALPVEGGEAQ